MRWPIAEGEELDLGLGAGARARIKHDRADRPAVPRRQRCGRVARIRPAAQSFVPNGFDLPEAKGSVSWIDDDTPVARDRRLPRGRRHHLGLCPHGAAVAARRRSRGRRRPSVRRTGRRRTSMSATHSGIDRTLTAGRADLSTTQSGFFDFEDCVRRLGSTCRPACRPTSITAGSLSSLRNAWTDRRARVSGRATACWASVSTPSSTGSRDFTLLFEPRQSAAS